MHAVFRENFYPPDLKVHADPGFREFQRIHAEQNGYLGSIVSDVGAGRYLSITLWASEEDMDAAREALGPVVQHLIEPLMAAPSKLLGTGRVVEDDLTENP